MIAGLVAVLVTVAGPSSGTCGPDGLWVPTFPVREAPEMVVGADGALWNILPVTDGSYVIAGPTPTGEASVSVTVHYPSGTIPVRVEAPPGCGPTPTVTGGPAVVGSAAPTGEPSTITSSAEQTTTTAVVAGDGRDRTGMGGLIFILAVVAAAVVLMIARSVIRDSHRGMGGDLRPPDPTDPPPTGPTYQTWFGETRPATTWRDQNPTTVAPPPSYTPTVTQPAPPPTRLDPADPSTADYADEVARWLQR